MLWIGDASSETALAVDEWKAQIVFLYHAHNDQDPRKLTHDANIIQLFSTLLPLEYLSRYKTYMKYVSNTF